MNNRREVAALVGAGQVSMQFAQEHSDKIAVLDRVVAAARLGLMVAGLASMTALTAMFFRPELTDRIKVLSPFWTEPASLSGTTQESLTAPVGRTHALVAGAQAPAASEGTPSVAEQHRVSGWLAKRHRVAGAASKMLVDAAYLTAKEAEIDPLLILSVMSVQSRLNPFAENTSGAHGLMQVMADVHRGLFEDRGTTKSLQDPNANLRVGAALLRDSIRSAGSIEAGLKRYIGASDPRGDGGYAARVLGEYAKLQAVASGRYVAATRTPAAHANTGKLADKSKAAGDQPA